MELDGIIVKNFRSIKECSVSFNKITALVGENNAGKSTLLRALNSFFNYELEEENFIKKRHQYTTNSQPRIELLFKQVPNNSDLNVYCDNQKLVIRFTFNPQNNKRTFHYKKYNKYNPVNKSIIELIRSKINFILIPPIRDPEQIKWAEASLLKEIVDAYLDQATASRDNFTSKFKEATKQIERKALSKIAKEVKKIYSLNHSFSYDIKYDSSINYKTFLHDINFKVNEKGNLLELNDCGSGIQSLTFIALHRLLANFKKINTIIGLEEPETNLHPQAQKELISSIEKEDLSSLSSKIIFTTHSTVMIDQLSHEHVLLFRKVIDTKRGYKTKTSFITDSFFTDHNIEEFNYYQFHHYRNSDIFYAKFVIIVESKNDAQIIKLLAKQENIDLDLIGVSIINLEGINNLKYPFWLLKELDIPFFVILDKDYFLPYLNDNLSKSRDSTGFPKYKYEYKASCIIEDLVTKSSDRNTLLNKFKTNHSSAMDILESNNIVCMNYSLDIDLVASNIASTIFYDKLGVPNNRRTKFELLVNRKNQIKKIENLLHVVSQLPHKNLPNSYKRIKKILKQIAKTIKNN